MHMLPAIYIYAYALTPCSFCPRLSETTKRPVLISKTCLCAPYSIAVAPTCSFMLPHNASHCWSKHLVKSFNIIPTRRKEIKMCHRQSSVQKLERVVCCCLEVTLIRRGVAENMNMRLLAITFIWKVICPWMKSEKTRTAGHGL